MTTVSDIKRGDVVRFVPEARRNRVTLLVESVLDPELTDLVFIYGVRCTSEGVLDSQALFHSYPLRRTDAVEVLTPA